MRVPTSLLGMKKRSVDKYGKILLPNNYFEYFIDKTMNPNSSILIEEGLPITYFSHKNDLLGITLGKTTLTSSKKLTIPEVALDQLDIPKEVLLIGALDRLEVINYKDRNAYNKINFLTEKDLEQIAKKYNI